MKVKECHLQILCACAMEISFHLCVTEDTPTFSKQVCLNKDICEYLSLIQIKKNEVSHVQQYLTESLPMWNWNTKILDRYRKSLINTRGNKVLDINHLSLPDICSQLSCD